MVRPRSCRVIYYFDTPALGIRHQLFDRLIPHIKKNITIYSIILSWKLCLFWVYSSVFHINDLITKEVLLSGRCKDGLYVLSESSATSLPQTFLSTNMATSANIWHCRLGHPNSHIRSLLASNKKVVCTSHHHNFQCQACPLGKSSRLSLGPTSHKTSTPFGLIFSDVWVFTPMLSSDGFHYFVIFIDAYTKFIWFYPIPFPLTYRSPHHHLHLCLLIILQVQVLWCQLYLSRIRPLLQPL